MLDVFWWFIAVEAIGLAAFPIAYALLPRLRDRGYSVSKPLGLLLIGYSSWILSQIHVLPSVRVSILGLLVLMAVLSGWYVRTRLQEFLDFVRWEWRSLLAAEAIFLVLFVLWTVYRAYDPSIDHTEQPMDFAFLNASIRSFFGSPEDPWLRGEPISYYYFGYWMMGATTKLTSIQPAVAYNLSLALVPALAGVGIFGLVYNMVRTESKRLAYAVAGGVAAAVLLTLAANLEGVLEFMRANGMGTQGFWDWVGVKGLDGPQASGVANWRPDEFWWWFRATRVINTLNGGQWIDDTIQEFPFFSFMLGDLHPHVLSIPFVLLFLALCLNFLSPTPETRLEERGVQRGEGLAWLRLRALHHVPVVVMGLSLGGLAFTNMWDLPVFAALFLGIAALRAYSAHGGDPWAIAKGTLPIGVAVIGLAFLLFLPYYVTFNSQFNGLQAVDAATTRPVHLFLVWALLLAAVSPFVLTVFWRTTTKPDWAWQSAVSLFVGFTPVFAWYFLHLQGGGETGDLWMRLIHVLPLSLLISVAVYCSLWLARERAPVGAVFSMVLAALGMMLIMLPELVFVGDLFRSRMNTVFKFYYQAWIVLAVASGFAVHFWATGRRTLAGWGRLANSAWAAVFVVLLVGSLYYPAAAVASKGRLFGHRATLDGLAFVAQTHPGEYPAIRHIIKTVERGDSVLEAVGSAYFEEIDGVLISGYGRLSASTGVPTVLEWPGHELQWRGSSAPFEGREQDVATIYQTLDVEEAKELLAKYDVEYVYVGRREREKYGDEGMEKFSSFMDLDFESDGVRLYRLRR